jgi:hypothetical protein
VIAPKLQGGVAARTPQGDLGLTAMEAVVPWSEASLSWLGADLLWQLGQPGGKLQP